MIYNSVIKTESPTLDAITEAAIVEFSDKGYKSASLRNIVKKAGVTTGAFYGYYRSKEELFSDIVGKHYDYILDRFKAAQEEFAAIPEERQPENLSSISGLCMFDMLHYAYEHLREFKLILLKSDGTRFSHLIDEMVEIELDATYAYMDVLKELERPAPHIDEHLAHILVTGMFNAFFELVIHEMPMDKAENYLRELRTFYTAGWMKIMGQ